ncbi:MAG: glucose-1-phosphate cytidylyltransferase [Alphaproteobacteria bacterium]|nr:glucose-1-phosphate cytidylyltransferase [Alphaproteobacteria bacterium]
MTKLVILAGGLGTRFSEETGTRPKPMIHVGPMPILWHIMKYYAAYGIKEFIICAGYKQYMIKEFFANYPLHCADVTFDLKSGKTTVHDSSVEDWRVTVVDTGADTMTGGRIKRVRDYIGDAPFCLTYGDGLSDIDISALLAYHKKMGKIATLSAVTPPARFGELDIRDGLIRQFTEKKNDSERLINGGFMVLDPEFIDHIDGDETMLEHAPMRKVAEMGELAAFEHRGFWQCMDKLHDKQLLEKLWYDNKAPWKIW